MAIRVYKPTSAGRRNASVSDFSDLTRSTPEKSLVRKNSKTGGRNSYGRITSRHRGGGHKRQYRLIDFKRWDKDGVPAKVAEIEYDPNRSARIALLHFADGEKRYIIAPKGVKQGDVIETGAQADIKPGNNLPLKNIPTGTVVHAIELRPLGGAKIARSAGAAVQLVAKDGAYAQLRMPSGEIPHAAAPGAAALRRRQHRGQRIRIIQFLTGHHMHASELVGVHVPQSDDAVEPAVGMAFGGLCPALFAAAIAQDLFGQFPVCTRAVGLSQGIRLQRGINASEVRASAANDCSLFVFTAESSFLHGWRS